MCLIHFTTAMDGIRLGDSGRVYVTAAILEKYQLENSNRARLSRAGAYRDEWQKFATFLEWSLANGYSETLTIDRIDNFGNYCPSNCRWVSAKQNNENRRKYATIDRFTDEEIITEWIRRHKL